MATENLTGEKLAKRFGWWWRGDPVPVKSLRRAFPEKSEQGIRRFLWKELERAALNYELASRANSQKKYLLGKPFDRLTRKQMCDLALFWSHKPRPLQPIRFLPYADQPEVTATLRRLEDEEASSVVDSKFLIQQAVKRAQRIAMVEKEYAQITQGWTAPQYLTINLAECGDTSICNAFREHVKAQRDKLGIAAPTRNQFRANKSSKRGLSFHKIEALDVWSLPRAQRKQVAATRYDAGQKRRARLEARKLLRTWQDFNSRT